jgi:hypothetical protein
MDSLFCKKCKNIHRSTTEFSYCSTCMEICYHQSDLPFQYVSAKALGFIAFLEIDSEALVKALDFESEGELLEYFHTKTEYFPNHFAGLVHRDVRHEYLRWILDLTESPSSNSFKDQETLASALSELKYLLYGSGGSKSSVNPVLEGKYTTEFKLAKEVVVRLICGLNLHGLTHHCDICSTIGSRQRMLSGGRIHPNDGCLWCV